MHWATKLHLFLGQKVTKNRFALPRLGEGGKRVVGKNANERTKKKTKLKKRIREKGTPVKTKGDPETVLGGDGEYIP